MIKKVGIFHSDLDGLGCSIVFKAANYYLKENIDYLNFNCNIGIDVTNTVEEVLKRKDICDQTIFYFADIVPPKETLQKLLDNQFRVKIYDHHKSNKYVLSLLPSAIIISDPVNGKLESGTSILYKYLKLENEERLKKLGKKKSIIWKGDECLFYNVLIPIFVDTVRSYDTFEWKDSNNMDAKKLQILSTLLDPNLFINNYLKKFKNGCMYLFTKTELEFIQSRIDNEDSIIAKFSENDIIPINVKGYNCALIMGPCGVNFSRLGNSFLERYPKYDFIAQFSINDMTIGVRSLKDDFDLTTELDGYLSPKGHPKAAGCKLPDGIKNKIVKLIIDGFNNAY